MHSNKILKITTKFIFLTIIGLIFNNVVFASDILVTFKNGNCNATVAGEIYPCALGRNGISNDKLEGDGTTPIGQFSLRKIYYRADKISKAELKNTALPIQEIKITDGWSDDPNDAKYNTLVNLSTFDKTVSHESMYRNDDLYNIVIEVGYNDDPIVPGKGSAVFIRVAEPDYAGTAGGIAFSQNDLLHILPQLNSKSKLIVE